MTEPTAIESPVCRAKLECRLCGHAVLREALTLPATPPANAFVSEPVEQEHYPLEVRICARCGHAQLGHVVDANVLFRDYVYVSGTSPVFRKHFQDYAETVRGRVGLRSTDLVCEIGSNDGTLLGCFAGSRVLGIEPATNIAAQANAAGIPTINDFFSVEVAREIRERHGQARVILANNVMAHIDDLSAVIEGVEMLLADDGLFVMEVQYVGDLLRDALFDMIYFEHVDYHAVTPLIPFFRRHGLLLTDVEHVSTHGGSIRCYCVHDAPQRAPGERVRGFESQEEKNGTLTVAPWLALADKISARKEELRELLSEHKRRGRRIAGYGAPAKLTTLLYTFGIDREILEYVVDDSPLKAGRYTPGLHIPVRPSEALYDPRTKPDVVLICAWNFADSIMAKHAELEDVSWITPLG